jgi:hypothetical protein
MIPKRDREALSDTGRSGVRKKFITGLVLAALVILAFVVFKACKPTDGSAADTPKKAVPDSVAVLTKTNLKLEQRIEDDKITIACFRALAEFGDVELVAWNPRGSDAKTNKDQQVVSPGEVDSLSEAVLHPQCNALFPSMFGDDPHLSRVYDAAKYRSENR